MENGHWERAKEIFSQALDQPSEIRDGFVRGACGADDVLLHDVLRLLEAHNRPSGMLSRPMMPLIFGGLTEEPPRFQAPTVVARRFQIIGLIARGGMGDVYAAEDLQLGVRIALKTIRPEIAADARVLDLFKNEIQVARRVTHPNVCRIYDLAEHGEPTADGGHQFTSFLTMELLTGKTLSEHLQRHGPFSPEDALTLIQQLASALQAAHDAGVVHRDFKPGNVMLLPTEEGLRAVITDFGLAVVREQAGLRPLPDAAGGTPAYMAPEQLSGGEVTAATDVFSFGLVIAEMVGARLPKRKSPDGHPTSESPANLELSGASQRWEPILRRCLETDPTKRYPGSGAVAKAIADAAAPSQPTRRRLPLLVGIAAALALAVLGAASVLMQTDGWPSPERVDPVQLTRIAGEPESEVGGIFSPDGTTLAYLRGGRFADQVMLLSEGSPIPRKLLQSAIPLARLADWTPDGKRLCYYVARVPNLWCVGAVNGEPSLLLAGEVLSPQFTPDGKSLVFLRRINRNLAAFHSSPPGAAPKPLDIELNGETALRISPDGSKLATAKFGMGGGLRVRRFRDGPPHQLAGEPGWALTGFHGWFPDNRHLLLAETHEGLNTQRLVIADSESPARRLVLTIAGVISSATLSADGRRIVYASSGDEDGANISEFSTDGRRVGVVVRNAFNGVWTPGQNGLLYDTESNGRASATWTQSLNGAPPVKLRDGANFAVYSPDGRRIAHKVQGEHGGIEILASTGGQPTRIMNTSTAFGPGGPCWSHDGKWIFYLQSQKLWRIASEGGGQPEALADVLRALVCSPSGRAVHYYPLPKKPVAPGGFADKIAVMSTDTLAVRTISLKRDLLLASGAVSRDGEVLYAPQLDRQSLDVLNTRTGEVIRTVRLNLEPTESIETMSVHADGERLLVTTIRQPIDLWQAEGFSVPERGWLRWFRHWAPAER